MPLVHGQHISAGEVERAVSSWDAEHFARLCNSIAWATTWAGVQTLPAFTERVLVADKGIDAEWIGDMAPGLALSGSFLRSGSNVFQYKKREVVERTRSEAHDSPHFPSARLLCRFGPIPYAIGGFLG